MRRILVLLIVVALMMVMLAMSVAPAFAKWETTGPGAGCRTGSFKTGTFNPETEAIDKNRNGLICEVVRGPRLHFYDDKKAQV
jgi:hypothetical protein